jgi:hypothetical protein
MMKKSAAILTLAFALGFAPALQAQNDPFFKGKTIRIIGGSGGFYESWARLLARHMGKHIPGNPISSCKTCLARDRSSRQTMFTTWRNPMA